MMQYKIAAAIDKIEIWLQRSSFYFRHAKEDIEQLECAIAPRPSSSCHKNPGHFSS